MPWQPSPQKRAELRERWRIAQEDAAGPWNDFKSPPEEDDGPWSDYVDGTVAVDTRSDAEKNAGAAISVFDMITPSWGDEIVSGAMSILPGRGSYEDEVAKARKIQQGYREHEPWDSRRNLIASGAGLIGGIAPATKIYKGFRGAARALSGGPAATTLGRGLQAATGLAGTGAVYGGADVAGRAEGGAKDRLDALGIDAGTAPLVGAGFGIIGGGLGVGGSRLAQRGYQALRGVRGVEDKASRYLAEKLLQSGQTVDDLAAQHAKAAQTGKPVALGDVGPQGLRDAGGAAGRTPGPGREVAQGTILPRQEGQVARVTDDVAQAAGGKPGSFTQTVDDLNAQRAAEAKPLYQQALGSNKPASSPKIVEITNRPSGKAAMQRGLKIAQDEGIPESELVIRDGAGNITGYSAKALHYMKQGLDDMIESAQRSGDNSAARAFSIMKKELLGEMDSAIPGYAKAREVFAGHSANKQALEKGRQAAQSSAHPDQIRSEMSGMSPGEREFYRRGFAQRVIEEVEKSPDGGNAARRIFGNTAKRERMRAVLGDEEYNRLAERLGVEDAMYSTYRRTNVGSETAERIAAQNDINESLIGQSPGLAQAFLTSMSTGTISPLLQQVGLGVVANLLRGVSQRARGHIAKMLFSTDPNEVKMALQAIAKEYKNAQAFQAAQEAMIAQMAANEKSRAASGAVAGQAAEYVGVAPY